MTIRRLPVLLCLVTVFIMGTACSSLVGSPQPMVSPLAAESPLQPTPAITGDETTPGVPPSEAQGHVEGSPDAPAPQSGKASMAGVLYTYLGKGPIPDTPFYLSPAQDAVPDGETVLLGPQADRGDIRGRSDMQGGIALNNIPPGSYNLFVWAPMDWVIAVEAPDSNVPLVIVLQPDERKAVGTVNVPWP